jgi:hypothetical protein
MITRDAAVNRYTHGLAELFGCVSELGQDLGCVLAEAGRDMPG